jgi:hypothetical protein
MAELAPDAVIQVINVLQIIFCTILTKNQRTIEGAKLGIIKNSLILSAV